MPIVNANKDSSEQQHVIEQTFRDTTTGQSAFVLFRAPYPMQIMGVTAIAVGLSGSPTSQLALERFVVGAGLTVIAVGGALTHNAWGTSGAQGFSLPAAGNSLLNLAAGDVLTIQTGGANTGAKVLHVAAVVKALQDIKSFV
jgi:hypothetical protein